MHLKKRIAWKLFAWVTIFEELNNVTRWLTVTDIAHKQHCAQTHTWSCVYCLSLVKTNLTD